MPESGHPDMSRMMPASIDTRTAAITMRIGATLTRDRPAFPDTTFGVTTNGSCFPETAYQIARAYTKASVLKSACENARSRREYCRSRMLMMTWIAITTASTTAKTGGSHTGRIGMPKSSVAMGRRKSATLTPPSR